MTKLGWDFLIYMSIPFPLFRFEKLFDPSFFMQNGELVGRAAALAHRVPALFRQWDSRDRGAAVTPVHLDATRLRRIITLQTMYRAGLDEDQVVPTIAENVAMLEQTAPEIFNRVIARLGIQLPQPATNPYGIGLDPAAWSADGLFMGPPREISPDVKHDVGLFWLD